MPAGDSGCDLLPPTEAGDQSAKPVACDAGCLAAAAVAALAAASVRRPPAWVASEWNIIWHVASSFGCGSKKWYQNRTLASGNLAQSLLNPSNFEPDPFGVLFAWLP